MNKYTVLYRDASLLPADPPLIFQCDADDGDHAEEQCDNAYPGCEVVWIVETADVDAAYADYWGSTPSSSDNLSPGSAPSDEGKANGYDP